MIEPMYRYLLLIISHQTAMAACLAPNCLLEKSQVSASSKPLNIQGEPLTICSQKPLTGFYRNGTCQSDERDKGNHSVCAIMTQEFLEYTKTQGNDLSTPNPRYGFPGLKPGDKWCLCAARFLEAKQAGIKLKVKIDATSIRAVEVTSNFE